MLFHTAIRQPRSMSILAYVLVFWLLPMSAFGFFSRVQTAPEQSFSAGTLTLTPVAPQPANLTVTPSESAYSLVTIETVTGSIPAHYDITSIATDGNSGFCEQLAITATNPASETIVGTAPSFESGPQDSLGVWEIDVSTTYDSVAGNGAICTVEFLVETWNEQVGKGGGFIDDATFSLTVQFALTSDDDESGAGGEADPTDDPVVADPAQTVIINELNWAGSGASSLDQWIELHNLGSDPVDISGWHLTNAKPSNGTSTLPAGSVIPAGGYYLIARYASGDTNSAFSSLVTVDFIDTISLANTYSTNGVVKLKKSDGTIVDQTPAPPGSDWPEGNNQTGDNLQKWSMQRGENPGDGSDPGNWYTCNPTVLSDDGTLSIMQSYWLTEYATSSCGTPGHENLSSNDPTSDTYHQTQSGGGTGNVPVAVETSSQVMNRDEKDNDVDTQPEDLTQETTEAFVDSQDEQRSSDGQEKTQENKDEENEVPGSDGSAVPGSKAREEEVNRNERDGEPEVFIEPDVVSTGGTGDDYSDTQTATEDDQEKVDEGSEDDAWQIDDADSGATDPVFDDTDTGNESVEVETAGDQEE